uniref:Glycosyltransferase n=1 Tax=viral metagenome TaxID=1070528 RepID=A0A6C0D328_9ZZZZ
MRKALCLLTKSPNKVWIDFLNSFTEYDIFIVIDDNSVSYIEMFDLSSNIKIIQIDNNVCYHKQYTNCNSAVGFSDVISWDKALYIMSEIYVEYDNIWFIEDDVFIHSENTLLNIDKQEQYNNADFLSATNDIIVHNDQDKWNEWWNHWVNIYDKIDLPWSHSMVCACRVSRKLIDKIIEYKNKKKHLFFIEAMFNTISLQNGFIIKNPIELSNIHWRTPWNKDEIDTTKLYHPIKNIEDHEYIRKKT